MEVWSKDTLNNAITKLKEQGKVGYERCVMYVLSPLVTSLGYDVFNMDEVDTDIYMGSMKITVSPDVRMSVSLSSALPVGDTDKLHVHLDVDEPKLSLYMKALGKWELVEEVHLDKGDDNRKYPLIMRVVVRDTLTQVYAEKGERLFTEGVLKKKLSAGEVDNRFVREVLKEELKSPSDNFIRLIAEGLVKKFSTDNASEIVKGLMPLQSEGLNEIFTTILVGTENGGESSLKEMDKKQFTEEGSEIVTTQHAEDVKGTMERVQNIVQQHSEESKEIVTTQHAEDVETLTGRLKKQLEENELGKEVKPVGVPEAGAKLPTLEQVVNGDIGVAELPKPKPKSDGIQGLLVSDYEEVKEDEDNPFEDEGEETKEGYEVQNTSPFDSFITKSKDEGKGITGTIVEEPKKDEEVGTSYRDNYVNGNTKRVRDFNPRRSKEEREDNKGTTGGTNLMQLLGENED